MDPKVLEEFHPFARLPPHIRRKIWNIAAHSVPGRTIHIHPHPSNNPGVAFACRESLQELYASNVFLYCRTDQILSRIQFNVLINPNTDLLYLDERVKNSKNPEKNPIPTSLLLYSSWLLPIRQLAINLKDTKAFLPGIFGPSSWYVKGPNLWRLLGKACPELEYLWIVDTGPFELGYDGELMPVNFPIQQLNRSFNWTKMWLEMHRSLNSAKMDGYIRDVLMRPLDMNKVQPMLLPPV